MTLPTPGAEDVSLHRTRSPVQIREAMHSGSRIRHTIQLIWSKAT